MNSFVFLLFALLLPLGSASDNPELLTSSFSANDNEPTSSSSFSIWSMFSPFFSSASSWPSSSDAPAVAFSGSSPISSSSESSSSAESSSSSRSSSSSVFHSSPQTSSSSADAFPGSFSAVSSLFSSSSAMSSASSSLSSSDDVSEPSLPFDGRTAFTWCSDFYAEVGRSSFCCGDCWAHAAAQHLGLTMCVHRIDNIARPLSAYDAVSCFKGQRPCYGKDYTGVRTLAAMGLTTGSNVPGESGGCKSYKFLLCDPRKELPLECPNHDSPFDPEKKYEIKEGDCKQECDDPSKEPFKRFGTGSDTFNVPNSIKNIDGIKKAIENNGSVISAYYVNVTFVGIKGYELIEKSEATFTGYTNHYVLIVGWGSTKPRFGKVKSFWIIKNPNAGKAFAKDGYFRVLMGKNINGIEKEVFYIDNKSWHPQGPRNCPPRHFVEVRYVEIDGNRRKCKARHGGFRCPSHCSVSETKRDYLDFYCQSGKTAIALLVDIAVSCVHRG